MPSILRAFGYNFFFWSNENDPLEPIHIHFVKNNPSKNSPKAFLLKNKTVKFINCENIKSNELAKIEIFLIDNWQFIVDEWYNIFEEIKFLND